MGLTIVRTNTAATINILARPDRIHPGRCHSLVRHTLLVHPLNGVVISLVTCLHRNNG